ncbi:MAG: LysM peptidoglycan-binding domain-containing protein, partial [Lachnospiraceae bacterium]|nr:LysM peptidoglycan-binding domain-containing protein [Lachnospiraceae bacterium]
SYTKLEELNQAAVEVFFAMENEEAAEAGVQSEDIADVDLPEEELPDTVLQAEGNADADIPAEGTVLRLADLDAKFEEENQAAMQEEPEDGEAAEAAEDGKQSGEENVDGHNEAKSENGQEEDGGEDSAGQDEETVSTGEMAPSEQAFARNFAEYYKIEKGDTLNKISIKIYGNTGKVKEICELNEIKDPDNIKYGQKILLP